MTLSIYLFETEPEYNGECEHDYLAIDGVRHLSKHSNSRYILAIDGVRYSNLNPNPSPNPNPRLPRYRWRQVLPLP